MPLCEICNSVIDYYYYFYCYIIIIMYYFYLCTIDFKYLQSNIFLLIASSVHGGILVMNLGVKPFVETVVKSQTQLSKQLN